MSLIASKISRGLVALGVLVAAVAMSAAVVARPAAADGTRTITGSTTCTSGIVPYGFSVNYGSGWTYEGGTSIWLPGTQTKVWTWVIPSSATSFALDTFCYANSAEYNGTVMYPQGTWEGYPASLTPGTSNVTSAWSCGRYQVYPGPWVRTCSATSISYG
jgi:hypothetical protein